MNASVITCKMAYTSQKYIRFPQFAGSKGSQFRLIGRQISRVPSVPVKAQIKTKARNPSQHRWKLGSGKMRRYCNRTVAFISVIAALYPNVEIHMNWIEYQKSVTSPIWMQGRRTLRILESSGRERREMWLPNPNLVAAF
jgi:hypothetical protein